METEYPASLFLFPPVARPDTVRRGAIFKTGGIVVETIQRYYEVAAWFFVQHNNASAAILAAFVLTAGYLVNGRPAKNGKGNS